MNLRSFSVRARLAGAFAVTILALIAVTSVGAWQSNKTQDLTQKLIGEQMHEQAALLKWRSAVDENMVRTRAALETSDMALATSLTKDMKATSALIDQMQKEVDGFMQEPEERRLFAAVLEARKGYAEKRSKAVAAQAAGNVAQAQALLEQEVTPAVAAYRAAVEAVMTASAQATAADAASAVAFARTGLHTSLAVTALAVALAAVLAWRVARSINEPLNAAVAAMTKMAEGDMRVHIADDGRDEPAVLLRQIEMTAHAMSDVLKGMQQSADSVRTASREIAAGNQDLSSRTESQASSLEESAAAVEELSAAVANNAQVSMQASQMSGKATDVALTAAKSVDDIEQTMTRIYEASTQVSEFIATIDGIAFQTNLLALNAAVEAAHAGDQGRGFAVVATEVRNLARRSADAAKEIKAVVAQTLAHVSAGVAQVDAAGDTMQTAREQVERVRILVDEIAESTREQATGLGEINQAIGSLDAATQQNSALVEESAAASQVLSEQSEALAALAQRFKVAA